MLSEALGVDWEEILDKLSSYEGTIRGFCKENNISVHQLDYRRRKLKNKNTPVFHAVSMKDKDPNESINEEPVQSKTSLSSTIKIEIGKAKIFIPSHDKVALSNILKVIMASC